MKPKRHHDRGAYRSIFTVLLDGKDFRALDKDARWTFVALKLTLGQYQIGVLDAPEHILAAKTGCTIAIVRRALMLLEEREWIRHEANVYWVVRGLQYEPSFNVNDKNHRTGLRNFLDTLPRLPIVADFRLHYREHLGEGPRGVREGSTLDSTIDPTQGPSKSPSSRETETETETEPEVRATAAGARAEGDPTPEAPSAELRVALARPVNRALLERFGEDTNPLLPTSGGATRLLTVVQEHGIPLDFAESELYAAANRCPERPRTLSYFADGLVEAWQRAQARHLATTGAAPPSPQGQRKATLGEQAYAIGLRALGVTPTPEPVT